MITNPNFLVPKSLPRDVGDLWYVKLRIVLGHIVYTYFYIHIIEYYIINYIFISKTGFVIV